jgi:hypothetical protein
MVNSCNGLVLGAVVFGLVCSSASSETDEPEELVSSPDFRSSEPGAMPRRVGLHGIRAGKRQSAIFVHSLKVSL